MYYQQFYAPQYGYQHPLFGSLGYIGPLGFPNFRNYEYGYDPNYNYDPNYDPSYDPNYDPNHDPSHGDPNYLGSG
jgi:hypothetical protein